MKSKTTGYAAGTVLLGSAVLLTACEIDVEDKGKIPDIDVSAESGQMPKYEIQKTQEGKLPKVDVDIDPGKMPEVDIRGPEIEVKRETITVPDVDVQVKEKEIEVPTLDVTLPKDGAE